MIPSLKIKQTLLVKFLTSIGCKPVAEAVTGSVYTKFATMYTSTSVIRISDHLSADRSYIHVLLSPISKNISVVYKNFFWTGDFKECKMILYTLIMSKQVCENAADEPVMPANGKEVVIENVKKNKPAAQANQIKKQRDQEIENTVAAYRAFMHSIDGCDKHEDDEDEDKLKFMINSLIDMTSIETIDYISDEMQMRFFKTLKQHYSLVKQFEILYFLHHHPELIKELDVFVDETRGSDSRAKTRKFTEFKKIYCPIEQ